MPKMKEYRYTQEYYRQKQKLQEEKIPDTAECGTPSTSIYLLSMHRYISPILC